MSEDRKPLKLVGTDSGKKPPINLVGVKKKEESTGTPFRSSEDGSFPTKEDPTSQSSTTGVAPPIIQPVVADSAADVQSIDEVLNDETKVNEIEDNATAKMMMAVQQEFEKKLQIGDAYQKGMISGAEAEQQLGIVKAREEKAAKELRLLYERKESPKELTALDAIKDFKDNPEKLIPFLSGAAESEQMYQLVQAANRLDDNTATDSDLLLLKQYVDKAKQDKTFWYDVVDIVGQLPAFAGELLSTAGIYTAARKATVETAQKGLKNLLTEGGEKLLEKKITQYGLKIAGGIAGATAQTVPASATRIPAGTLQRMLPDQIEFSEDEQKNITADITKEGDDVSSAMVNALGDQWIEVLSERSGGLFTSLAKPMRLQAVRAGIYRALFKANPGVTPSKITQLVRKAGWNGVLSEMGEERLGEIGRAVLGIDDKPYKLPTKDQLLKELIAFSIPGAAISGANAATTMLEKESPKKEEKKDDSGFTEKEKLAMVDKVAKGEKLTPEEQTYMDQRKEEILGEQKEEKPVEAAPTESSPVEEKKDQPEEKPIQKPEKPADNAKEEVQAAQAEEVNTEDKNRTSSGTTEVETSSITTNEKDFQNRVELDQKRVDQIAKNWDWNKYNTNPITVFEEKDGSMVVLAGHHRYAAAKKAGIKNIPVVKFQGTRQEAKDFALDSNTFGAQETDNERASRYRKMRESGETKTSIQEKIKEAHGKNWEKIYNMSYLDAKGKAMQTLESFSKAGDVQTQNEVTRIADWIGKVKSTNPDISRKQENEMYDFLMSEKSSKITTKDDFKKYMNYFIDQSKDKDGNIDPEYTYNLKLSETKDSLEDEYQQRVKEAEKKVSSAQNTLDNKRAELISRGADEAQLDRILPAYEDQARAAQMELAKIRGEKAPVMAGKKAQTNLFEVEDELQKRRGDKNRPASAGIGMGVLLPHKERIEKTILSKEERIAAAQNVEHPAHGPLRALKDWTVKMYHSATKKYPTLDYSKHAAVGDALRRREGILDFAKWKAKGYVEGIVSPLTTNEYDLFSKKVVLQDILNNYKKGTDLQTDLPFGYESIEEVEEDMALIEADIAKSKEASEAFKVRENLMEAIYNDLQENELIPKHLGSYQTYFHRRVIQYMQENPDMADKVFGGLIGNKKAWQYRRGGLRGKDFSTNYIETEFKVLAESIYEIENKKLMINEVLQPFDMSKQLKKEAKDIYEERLQDIGETFGDTSEEYIRYAESKSAEVERIIDQIMPEGYERWQPVPGRNIFKQELMTERELMDFFGYLEFSDNQMFNAAMAMEKMTGFMKEMAVLGGKKKEYIIPGDIADTIREIKSGGSQKLIPGEAFIRGVTSAWKVQVLISPFRVIKYNLNNTSGDIDMAISSDPRILLNLPKAGKMMWKLGHNQETDENVELALKLSVINSGQSLAWLSDISETQWGQLFQKKEVTVGDLIGKSKAERMAKTMNPIEWAKTYYRIAREYTDIRENVARYAAFMTAQEQIAKGIKPYWKSYHKHIDQIKDPDVRAARLARDAIGDYGNISQFGERMSKSLMPFFRWIEVVMGGYINQFRNVARDFDQHSTAKGLTIAAGRLIPFLVKAAFLAVLIDVWNRLLWPELYKKMRANKMDGHKVIVGQTAEGQPIVIPFQGAFYDFISKFGLEDPTGTADDVLSGEITPAEFMTETGKNIAGEFYQGLNPFLKALYELPAGQTMYPDPFNPRPIHDRAEYLSQMASLDKVYRAAKGLPVRGNRSMFDPMTYITYDYDPGQQSYYYIKNKIGKFQPGGEGDPKTKDQRDALRIWRQAVRYRDEEAADRFLKLYYELGGTARKKQNAIKGYLHPLDGLDRREKADVIGLLSGKPPTTDKGKEFTKKDIERLRMAMEWYDQVFASKKK